MKATNLRKRATMLMMVASATLIATLTGCGTKNDPDMDREFTIPLYGGDQWTPFPAASDVIFNVSNRDILATDDDGNTVQFTGLKPGDATIIATANEVSSRAVVHVVEGGGNGNSGGDPIIWDPNDPKRPDPKGPKDDWIGAFVYGTLEYKLEINSRGNGYTDDEILFVNAPIVAYFDYNAINAYKKLPLIPESMLNMPMPICPFGYSLIPLDVSYKEKMEKDPYVTLYTHMNNPQNYAPIKFSYSGNITAKSYIEKSSGDITTTKYETPILVLINKYSKSLSDYSYKMRFTDTKIKDLKWIHVISYSNDGSISEHDTNSVPNITFRDWFDVETDISGIRNPDFNGITINKTEMDKLLNNPSTPLKIPFEVIMEYEGGTQHITGSLTLN
jgi:hypothetical protein